MASRRLRKQLRKLLLAVPVIGGVGCGGGIGTCPDGPRTADVPDAGAFISNGAFDCNAACKTLNFETVNPDSCTTGTAADGGLTVTCEYPTPCHTGRRPEGLLAGGRPVAPSAVGALLAECARLEAAAVHAFARTARELTAHQAPSRLIARAKGAAADEVRHARSMRAHARRHHATPLRAEVARASGTRSLFDLAIENAVEGCVRETYGALAAQWQAKTALDPSLRRSLKSIAHDETHHAELSWDLKAWLDSRLSAREREQVRAAMRAAISELTREVETEPATECSQLAGLPTANQARLFVASLREEVWRC